MAVITAIFFFNACQSVQKSFSARISEYEVSNMLTDMSHFSGLFLSLSGETSLYNIKNNLIRFHAVDSDSTIRTYRLKAGANILAADVVDEENFVVLLKNGFVVYRDGVPDPFETASFSEHLIVMPQYGVKYYKDLNVVVLGAFTDSTRRTMNKTFDTNFIAVFDLDSRKVSFLDLRYPAIYHGNKLGEPKCYFSRSGQFLLVSFNYFPTVFSVNLKDNNLKKYSITYSGSTLKPHYDDSKGKMEKLDMLYKNQKLMDQFGIALLDQSRNRIYRIYRPVMPDVFEGIVLSNREKGCIVLNYDISKKTISEHILPSGLYFMSGNWVFNEINKEIQYLKIYERPKTKGIWTFRIHSLLLLDF